MRGYGLPRNDDVQNPDVSDIQLLGLAKNVTVTPYFGEGGFIQVASIPLKAKEKVKSL